MKHQIKPRYSFDLFGRVFVFGCEFAEDGCWTFTQTESGVSPYRTSDLMDKTTVQTDFISFGMVSRKGFEDIVIFRFVFGAFLFVFGFSK